MDDPANALPPIPESGLSPGFAGESLPAAAPVTNAPPAARRSSGGVRRRLLALAGAGLAGLLAAAWLTGPRLAWFAGWGGPREIARAQLAEIDRGQVRAAYDLFSVRYRRQVTFEEWRDLMVTHARMLRTHDVRFGDDNPRGGRDMFEVHLTAESGERYVARFTMIRSQGRWWVDDLHWGREPAEGARVRV
jgi:hypothetical protein